MSRYWRRRLAVRVCSLLEQVAPPHLRVWARAISAETAQIAEDDDALSFAASSLCGLMPQLLAFRLLQPIRRLLGETDSIGADEVMRPDGNAGRARVIGIACAVGATLAGLAYLVLAGAPARHIAVNAGALALGMMLMAAVSHSVREDRRRSGALVLLAAIALLATAFAGAQIDGAARWVSIGGLSVQPSLVLLPMMIVGFARTRTQTGTAGMIVAAAALALQPDRAMAGMLAAALATLAAMQASRRTGTAAAAGAIGFAATLIRDDRLPAVPFVDQILYSAFDVHPLAGAAVLMGSALLVLPAIAGLRGGGDRAVPAVFGVAWLATIAAAAMGNYPTPIVGYGGSAIVGYLLSLSMLPRQGRTHAHPMQGGSAAPGRAPGALPRTLAPAS